MRYVFLLYAKILVLSIVIFTNGCATTKDSILLVTAENGNIEYMSRLLDEGADVNVKRSDGNSALMLASYAGHFYTVRLLVEKGAEINAKNESGFTALMIAASASHADIVEFLIEKGADVNAKNNNGATALLCGSESGSIEVVLALLKGGADVNVKTHNGKTPLNVTSDEQIKKILKSAEEGKFKFVGTDDNKLGRFLRRFEEAVYGVWRYPHAAAEQGKGGVTSVEITFNWRGEIEKVEILRSSGSFILDNEILRALRLIGSIGPLPKGFNKDRLNLIVNFQYGNNIWRAPTFSPIWTTIKARIKGDTH